MVVKFDFLRKGCRIRIFENMILRRGFGPKRDENADWRRLHNEELDSSPTIEMFTYFDKVCNL